MGNVLIGIKYEEHGKRSHKYFQRNLRKTKFDKIAANACTEEDQNAAICTVLMDRYSLADVGDSGKIVCLNALGF